MQTRNLKVIRVSTPDSTEQSEIELSTYLDSLIRELLVLEGEEEYLEEGDEVKGYTYVTIIVEGDTPSPDQVH